MDYARWSADDLEREFTLDGIADLEALQARRAEASEAARRAFRHSVKVPYGSRPGETLDLFPAEVAGAPVQIFIHGGFWQANDAAAFDFVAHGFVPLGAAVLVIDYDLYPEVDLATILEECRNAVGWAHRHAASFGGDPSRLFVSGNSAGGHLVAMLMDRAWPPARGLPGDVVKGGCAISGVHDLAPVAATSRQAVFRFSDDDIRSLSPLRLVPDATSPIIAAVGGDETPIFRHLNALYAEALRGRGVDVQEIVVPETNHLSVVLDAFARPGTALNRAVADQMGL